MINSRALLIVGMAICIPYSAFAASRMPDVDHPLFSSGKKRMTVEKAVEDIDRNFPLIVSMSEEFGESWYMTWGWMIADRLPSQPVAVIKVFAATGAKDRLSLVCPRFPSDDPNDVGRELDYLYRSAEALASFNLVDASEEGIRKECLANVRKNIELVQKQFPSARPSEPWPVKGK